MSNLNAEYSACIYQFAKFILLQYTLVEKQFFKKKIKLYKYNEKMWDLDDSSTRHSALKHCDIYVRDGFQIGQVFFASSDRWWYILVRLFLIQRFISYFHKYGILTEIVITFPSFPCVYTLFFIFQKETGCSRMQLLGKLGNVIHAMEVILLNIMKSRKTVKHHF